MTPGGSSRAVMLFAFVGGVVGLAVGAAGSFLLGVSAGLVCFLLGWGVATWTTRSGDHGGPGDPGRRRFLAVAGLGGLVWAAAGPAIGWTLRKLGRPDPRPVQEAMASDLGSEYMELVRRAYMPGRSGDLQLLLAPFNSSNYPNESLSLVPKDPRTSHASVWMYLERIPLVVYAPGRIEPADSDERVTLADLAPTSAGLMGFNAYPSEARAGRPLPGIVAGSSPPKVIVTFVIDGGGWNVLQAWPDRWPRLRELMRKGATYRNAIHGSFPAVTASAHGTIGTGTYPNQHGITGHNIRDDTGVVRKAYIAPGQADPSDIVIPTLADLWSDETNNRAWVGQIGYQVWHLGMLGFGGRNRGESEMPVAVFWDELGGGGWAPHNPELYRLPGSTPGLDVYESHVAAFDDPGWDAQFAPQGRQTPCCSPPIVRYQGDLIEATFDSEPVGRTGTTDLLYINYKSPDYTGHIYGMASDWEGLQLEAVDTELGRLAGLLEGRFGGDYVLIVTADHGQCPLPDSVGGVRLDPIQLQEAIEAEFNGATSVVQSVVPSEVYLDAGKLWDNGGATVEDVAALLQQYRYRQNVGPYVPRSAVEQDLLDQKEFAAVFATSYLETLAGKDLSGYGATAYPDGDELGIPGPL